MKTLNLKHTTLTEIFEGCYKDENGNSIYKDDFGSYIIMVNGNSETAPSLGNAVKTMNNDRYWR